jgi:urea transport system ATP-binding protein
MTMLELKNVASGYGSGLVIRDLSLQVAPGQVLAILGKNGMGKSSLLKTIMGQIPRIAGGSVAISGDEVMGSRPFRIARAGAAFVAQEDALFYDLTVGENLRLGAITDATFERRAELVYQHFGFLRDRRNQLAGTLSGGEQKMLLLARTLLGEHKVILIDEITEGLQPSVVDRVKSILADRSHLNGAAVVLVEQHVDFALQVADRYCTLEHGTIMDEGRCDDADARQNIMKRLAI